MVGNIINVPKPLTRNQNETFVDYSAKGFDNLTDKQKETFVSLANKHNQSKKYTLTDTIKNTLSRLVYAERHGRKIDLNSPQITKGLEREKDSRDLLSRVSGLFLIANEERKSNKWVTGKTDIKLDGIIPDIKTSWSWESFSKILQDKPNEIYLRQLDSYMDLWGFKDSILCHILVDTPSTLVEGEIREYDLKNEILGFEGDVKEDSIGEVVQIVTNHIFSREGLEDFCHQSATIHIEWFNNFKEIPEEERVHMIAHSYDKERIEQRDKCISLSREYMDSVRPINNFNPELLKQQVTL